MKAMLKMKDVQIIRDDKGAEAFAVVPWPDYQKLLARDDDADLIALGEAHRGEETFPADVARRLVAGEAPLKVIREWRGMSQGKLHDLADVPANYISQIERGERNCGRKVAARLAAALDVPADVLMDI